MPRNLYDATITGFIGETLNQIKQAEKLPDSLARDIITVFHLHLALYTMAWHDYDAVQQEIQRLVEKGQGLHKESDDSKCPYC